MTVALHGRRRDSSTGWRRRELLKRGGIGLAGIMLPALFGPAPVRAAAPQTVVIWNPDPFDGWLLNIHDTVQTFEKENPGVKVQVVQVPYSDLSTKVVAAHATNTLPDIIRTGASDIIDWASQGILLPVDDVLGKIGKNKFSPNIMNYTVYQGHPYAVPSVAYPHILFYRKDWYAEAGLKVPTTWDGLLANCKALHNPGKNRYGCLVFNKYPDINAVMDLMATNDASEFDKNGAVTVNSPQTVEALVMTKQLAQLSPPGSATKSQQDMRIVFAQGIGAHMITSTSMIDVLAQTPELVDKVSAFALPVHRGNRGAILGFYGWTITKAPGSRDPAKKFVETWARPDVALHNAQNGVRGYIPIDVTVAGDPRYRNAPNIKPFADYIAAGERVVATGVLQGERFGPNSNAGKIQAARIWTEMMDRVVVEGQDPKAVAAWAEKAIQDAIR